METWAWRHGDMGMETWNYNIEEIGSFTKRANRKWKTEAQAIFLNPFTVCSLCKWKFVVCLFVDEKTYGSDRLQTDQTD